MSVQPELDKMVQALTAAREGEHDIHVTSPHSGPSGYVFPLEALRKRFEAKIAEAAAADGRLLAVNAIVALKDAVQDMIDNHEARIAREILEKGIDQTPDMRAGVTQRWATKGFAKP